MPEEAFDSYSEARNREAELRRDPDAENVSLDVSVRAIFTDREDHTLTWDEVEEEQEDEDNDSSSIFGRSRDPLTYEDIVEAQEQVTRHSHDPASRNYSRVIEAVDRLRHLRNRDGIAVRIEENAHEIEITEHYERSEHSGELIRRRERELRNGGVSTEIRENLHADTIELSYTVPQRILRGTSTYERVIRGTPSNSDTFHTHRVACDISFGSSDNSSNSEPSEPSPEDLRDRLDFTENDLGTGRYKVQSKHSGLGSTRKLKVRAIDHDQRTKIKVHRDLYEKFEEGDILYFENSQLKGTQTEVTK